VEFVKALDFNDKFGDKVGDMVINLRTFGHNFDEF
jgi:hypothetical protein